MQLKTIKQINSLENKTVLVRVDFNVPIKNNKVLDNSRIKSSLPTIKYLIEKKAKIILLTHVGRPAGRVVSSLKVDPIIKDLNKLLKKKVKKLESKNWKLSDKEKIEILKIIEKLKSGQVAMLENIRFSADEKNNTGTLSQELANLADFFVLDGFAVAHRDSASVTGVAKYIPAYAGLLLQKEIKALQKITDKTQHPFVAIVGGAKAETKIPLLKSFLKKSDSLLVGGGIFNTILYASGYKVGSSLISTDNNIQKQILKISKNKKVILPIDVIVGHKNAKFFYPVDIKKKKHLICKNDEAVFDVGPKTILKFSKKIKSAKTLVWNGAFGYFEKKPYDHGTKAIARLLASRAKGSAYGVVGGGETLQVINDLGLFDDIDFVSTGGGAMLEFLSGKELPGIKVVSKK